jgi:DNA-binding winged helix-turn-helix (wHTH) protein
MTVSWYFPPFCFDPSVHALWRHDTRIAFQSKPAAVLEWLVRNAGTVVTNETLIHNIWSTPCVGATVVKACISRIRKALDDETQHPRYIETRPRLGYRFIGRVTAGCDDISARSRLVDADRALALIREQFSAADRGDCRVVFVTGAAGVGKTALCERFIRKIAGGDGIWIGRGRCSPATDTPWLSPIIDALADVCETTDGAIEAVERFAPSWLKPISTGANRLDIAVALQQPDTPSRMVREVGRMFDAVARQRTIVLIIDDVQHADRRTVELLASIGRGPHSARILVLVTIRSNETVRSAYELATMRVELNLRNRIRDISLVGFPECKKPWRRAAGGSLPHIEYSSPIGHLQRRAAFL